MSKTENGSAAQVDSQVDGGSGKWALALTYSLLWL